MRRDRGRSESIALETSMLYFQYSCPAIPWHMLSLCLREVDSGCGVETQWIFSSSLLQCHLHVWHFKGWPWAVLGAVSEPEVLKMNHWMAKSAWQKKTPCHRNREKNLFGGLFLNGRLGSVENNTNYVALCEFPLALGHDMQTKKKKNNKPHKKRNENTFYHSVPFKGPEAVCVTSATFLCCTPATNTDWAGPGAGCSHFVYLGCKALENLSLSCTNGHLTPYWELHSHCLLCIPNTDLFNFPRLRSASFKTRLGFFLSHKSRISFLKFPFCCTDNAKGNGIWGNQKY